VEELAVPPVPDVHRPVTPRREASAVGAERHAVRRPKGSTFAPGEERFRLSGGFLFDIGGGLVTG